MRLSFTIICFPDFFGGSNTAGFFDGLHFRWLLKVVTSWRTLQARSSGILLLSGDTEVVSIDETEAL